MADKIRAALLIDADNLPKGQISDALVKLEAICNPIIRKAFGDFSNSAKNWDAEFLRQFGITPVQHYPVSKYKNGADIAMCIAAMDVLNTRVVDAIILFSSDSDFGPLASRIREAGIEVIGIGDKQTNETFKACFDKFIVISSSKSAESQISNPPRQLENPKVKSIPPIRAIAPKPSPLKAHPNRSLSEAKRIIQFEIENCTPDDGWTKLSDLGKRLKERSPRFIINQYGAATLGKLLGKIGGFIVEPKHKPPRVRVR